MVVACLALVVALSGTSYAALSLPAGSVGSKQVKNGSIRRVDIGKRTLASLAGKPGPQGLTGAQGPVGPRGPAGPAGVLGPAGGDLTGTFPKPSIRPGAVTGPKVADDSLTGSDIDEKTLGQVPSADKLDGRDSSEFQRFARTDIGLDLPEIPARACINKLIVIPQLVQNDAVVVNPPGNFPIGLVLTATADINKDSLQELRVCNATNGALDAPSGEFTFTILRP
jgi:hypothetical protein